MTRDLVREALALEMPPTKELAAHRAGEARVAKA